MEESSGTQ